MTSSIANTWTIGCCAFAFVAFTDAGQAQGAVYSSGPFVGQSWSFPWHATQQLPACSYVGQTVTLPLSTGSGGLQGTPDPIWAVMPGSAYSTAPVLGFWFPNTSNAKWIQPAAGGTPQNFAQGTYVYKTQFATPVHPYLYQSIKITGGFGADDEATVKLNGVPIATCSPSCFGFARTIPTVGNWQSFATSTGYLNVLTVEVKNTPAGDSPSGLFVRATVTAVCSKCTSPVPPAYQCGGNPSTC
jgi:hypothetical protein